MLGIGIVVLTLEDQHARQATVDDVVAGERTPEHAGRRDTKQAQAWLLDNLARLFLRVGIGDAKECAVSKRIELGEVIDDFGQVPGSAFAIRR